MLPRNCPRLRLPSCPAQLRHRCGEGLPAAVTLASVTQRSAPNLSRLHVTSGLVPARIFGGNRRLGEERAAIACGIALRGVLLPARAPPIARGYAEMTRSPSPSAPSAETLTGLRPGDSCSPARRNQPGRPRAREAASAMCWRAQLRHRRRRHRLALRRSPARKVSRSDRRAAAAVIEGGSRWTQPSSPC